MMTFLAQNILLQYLVWHYFDVPKKILEAWRNILVFNLEFFSVGGLLKTLFSYWRRYTFSYPRYFDIAEYFDIFLSNLISRGLGLVIRVFLIVLGIIFEIIIFLLGAVAFFGWLILPLILVTIFWVGVKVI